MTRYLTNDEIEFIVDFIKPNLSIPSTTAFSIVEANKNKLRNQLKICKVYPQIIPELKENIMKSYYSSLIEPGESVGIICAQSLGEKQTQNTLNTFHKAGQSEKSVITGVPRFQELLNATKDPKTTSIKIFFKKKHESIKDLRKTVNHQFVNLTFLKISKDIDVCMDKKPEKWYESFKILYKDYSWYRDFSKYKDCISIKVDIKYLYEYNINFEDIAERIDNEYDDLFCVFSPIHIGQFDVYVDTSKIKLPEDRILFINKENSKQIYMEECVKNILENMLLFGIDGIDTIYYTEENGEWIIETDGGDYLKVMSHKDVDSTRTVSNNVWDIYELLDIEASRTFLINEFLDIMEGINLCHVKLLVERMTFLGTISSISRYTMRKEECGPLGKASFEETLDNFLKAASNGETEPTTGVSASIICGKRARFGTGMIDLKIDTNYFKI